MLHVICFRSQAAVAMLGCRLVTGCPNLHAVPATSIYEVHLLLLCAWPEDLVKVEGVLLVVQRQGEPCAASEAAH
jgi:hypothetical protein